MRTSLFHGTIADIQGAVRPVGRGKGSVWGSTGWRFGQRADEHAFATEREDQAWDFASAAHRGHRQPNEALGHNRPDVGRARVYRVGPAPDQRMGAYHPEHPLFDTRDTARIRRGEGPLGQHWEHISKVGFPVLEQLDIKPDHQGTFPIDWRPWSTSHRADVNHPDPDEVHFGHSGSRYHREMRQPELDAWRAENYPKRPEEPPGQMHLALGPQFERMA